jgi:hypothetical protein
VLSGGDVHVSATFSCTSDADCAIGGSFFFEPQLQPQAFSVGDVVQLIGIEMQEWKGSAQLSGRNVRIVDVVSGNQKPLSRISMLIWFYDHRTSAGATLVLSL